MPVTSMFFEHLDEVIAARSEELEAWFAAEENGQPLPFYASVDIRNAGYKVAVIDTNLFPAGFNNLCDYSYRLGAEQVRAYFAQYLPGVRRLLVVPESNTRNLGYIANVSRLQSVLERAGLVVAVGSLIESTPRAGFEVEGADGHKIVLKRFDVVEGVPEVDGLPFDAVLLNHDLSGGVPRPIAQLRVPVVPRRVLGWHLRRKSMHFAKLTDVTHRFGAAFDVDPWLLHAETVAVESVSFDGPSVDEHLREAVGSLLEQTARAFAVRAISQKPYVYVKHDAGTYGMGVLPIYDLADLETITRDMRKRMQKGKGGVPITDVIVQEGVPTRDLIRDCYGEPVAYAMNNRIIGGFFRLHCEADELNSLNKPGQAYAVLCSTPTKEQSRGEACYHDSRLFRIYGLLAHLAGLAVMAERDALEQTQ